MQEQILFCTHNCKLTFSHPSVYSALMGTQAMSLFIQTQACLIGACPRPSLAFTHPVWPWAHDQELKSLSMLPLLSILQEIILAQFYVHKSLSSLVTHSQRNTQEKYVQCYCSQSLFNCNMKYLWD